ncbi:hypothetical protein BKG67_21500 [Mycobacteroides chelonae]|nr:hypothetical protein BKG66_22955 [Mycobacteroides chelonae]OHT69174.1 hypothetical protein BKG67_21500 [Mycobacteroides chelonae]
MNVHGDDAPQREDYEDVREFIRDHDAYWNAATPTKLAVLQRAARLANDAAMAIKMQFDRIDGGPMAGDPDGFWKALIDVDFLIAALWRLHLAGRLAQSALGGRWVPLEEFNAALPDLKLMRDVTQHIHEYGTDFDRRPTLGLCTGGEKPWQRSIQLAWRHTRFQQGSGSIVCTAFCDSCRTRR